MALLEVRSVSRAFSGVLAVHKVSLHVDAGETVSIIGPNGAGKTTLFNLITGYDRPTDGKILFDGQSTRGLPAYQYVARGIARTFQHGRVFGNLSVEDNVLLGAHSRRRAARPRSALLGVASELFYGLFAPPSVRQEEAQLRQEARAILALFGDRLLPRLKQPAYSLSYANRRRVEMARALMAHPRLLLLDEPTAGMNPTETAEVLEFVRMLKGRGLTILLIEHKLSLVMSLSDRVVVMDDGEKLVEGPPEAVRHDPRVIEAYLGHKHYEQESRHYSTGPAGAARELRQATYPAAGVL
jgi:branched-chain amino acid transport system ATP-binding protein